MCRSTFTFRSLSNALLLKAIQRGTWKQRNPGGFVDKQRSNNPNISLHQKWALYAAEHTLSQKKSISWNSCKLSEFVQYYVEMRIPQFWHKKLGLCLFSYFSCFPFSQVFFLFFQMNWRVNEWPKTFKAKWTLKQCISQLQFNRLGKCDSLYRRKGTARAPQTRWAKPLTAAARVRHSHIISCNL